MSAVYGDFGGRHIVLTGAASGIDEQVLSLPDSDVYRVLAFVMAETLEVGTAVVEALGIHLAVDMGDYWQPEDTFFDLLRDKTVINAILKQVAGKRIADGNVTATAKVQKRVIRDFLTGSEGREKVEDWMPDSMTFPFKLYTKNGGVTLADNTARVRKLFG